MKIYRLVRSTYKNDLSGEGSYLYGGRWNSRGHRAIYAAAHISLTILEILVNFDRDMMQQFPPYHLMIFEIKKADILFLEHRSLKSDWQRNLKLTQMIGDEFLKSKSSVIMSVPSAVVPEESNFLINIHHPDFHSLILQKSMPYPLDQRLLMKK